MLQISCQTQMRSKYQDYFHYFTATRGQIINQSWQGDSVNLLENKVNLLSQTLKNHLPFK